MNQRIMGAATLAAALLLSGCGGEADRSDTSTVAPVSTTTTSPTTTRSTPPASAPEFAPAPGGELVPR